MLMLCITFSTDFFSKMKGYSDVKLLATIGEESGFFLDFRT